MPPTSVGGRESKLFLAGRAQDLPTAIAQAREAIESGRALDLLERWRT
ncbi:MAG: hypothetical protein WD939_02145 [Dehalococcoidia bacterium]